MEDILPSSPLSVKMHYIDGDTEKLGEFLMMQPIAIISETDKDNNDLIRLLKWHNIPYTTYYWHIWQSNCLPRPCVTS